MRFSLHGCQRNLLVPGEGLRLRMDAKPQIYLLILMTGNEWRVEKTGPSTTVSTNQVNPFLKARKMCQNSSVPKNPPNTFPKRKVGLNKASSRDFPDDKGTTKILQKAFFPGQKGMDSHDFSPSPWLKPHLTTTKQRGHGTFAFWEAPGVGRTCPQK